MKRLIIIVLLTLATLAGFTFLSSQPETQPTVRVSKDIGHPDW